MWALRSVEDRLTGHGIFRLRVDTHRLLRLAPALQPMSASSRTGFLKPVPQTESVAPKCKKPGLAAIRTGPMRWFWRQAPATYMATATLIEAVVREIYTPSRSNRSGQEMGRLHDLPGRLLKYIFSAIGANLAPSQNYPQDTVGEQDVPYPICLKDSSAARWAPH